MTTKMVLLGLFISVAVSDLPKTLVLVTNGGKPYNKHHSMHYYVNYILIMPSTSDLQPSTAIANRLYTWPGT